MEFSKKTRELSIQKMQERTLDLLIIGGGITGAGVALQAAASGLETDLNHRGWCSFTGSS